MTREVEDSPNRCPRCQRVQISAAQLCPACEITHQAETDILDILDILSEITEGLAVEAYAERERADTMIASMREAIKKRAL